MPSCWSLGVAEPLLPLIRELTTEDELLGLDRTGRSSPPRCCFALHDGSPYDEVLDQVTASGARRRAGRHRDFEAAVDPPRNAVTTDDQRCEAM